MSGSGYDLSTSTFSPDGRVFQVEYAQKAVEKSGTAVGIKCVDGVVLGVEKIISQKLLAPSSNKKIKSIDKHAGMALAGIAGDAEKLVLVGREEAQKYWDFYGNQASGSVLAKRIAGVVHTYSLYWYLRPFGASALLAVYDADGPELYTIDPVGTGLRYFGTAIGKNKAGVKTELEKIDFSTITCKEAVFQIARIIYKLHDDVKDKDFELELSWICDDSNKVHVSVPEDLRQESIAKAIAEKEREEMGDSDEE